MAKKKGIVMGMGRKKLLKIIKQAAQDQRKTLYLAGKDITGLPPEIGKLTNLQTLNLNSNQLTSLPNQIGKLANLNDLNLINNQFSSLPKQILQLTNLQTLYLRRNKLTLLSEQIGQLANLKTLYLDRNQLTLLPKQIGRLTNLQKLNLNDNKIKRLPRQIGQLTNLPALYLDSNQLTSLPEQIGQLANLQSLYLDSNQLTSLPEQIGQLANLQSLYLDSNQLTSLPEQIGQLANLQSLYLDSNQLTSLPEQIGQLANLRSLYLNSNRLTSLPEQIGQLANLQLLDLRNNQLTTLPVSLALLEKLYVLKLDGNPLNPALESAHESGLDELRAYLDSLGELALREELYEAKLIFVGEGGVGKTTLLKAMTRKETKESEPTTHGVEIDVQALKLDHPDKPGTKIQLNAWDFGGQEVYRVTHQFFFSRRSIYLLVWEPRRGVQQCQVEDWLRLIRLRVGDNARVIIVSTHCRTGERIARIDKPILQRDFGSMIVGFHEVDGLVDDQESGDKVGVSALKDMIAEAAKGLEQMGMEFNRNWREARDELLEMDAPRIPYSEFAEVCGRHSLNEIAAKTLADLMHDLGYIVYYREDERLKDDVVLQPEWLTKAIGFVLEDRKTQEMDGILLDSRLKTVWWDHPFEDEPRYKAELYPFFLRLMERYEMAYRLEDGSASLVAQHVPQVRPGLPWLPEEERAPGARRISLVCVMEEAPPGLVPWMIVRTHGYAYEQRDTDARIHRLHWQKGMFLRNRSHGEAVLELRGREFHVYTEAVWPEYFLNVLKQTLHKLITDNWPGLRGRYYFAVPCRSTRNGRPCDGRFDIDALRQFLDEGDEAIRCQICRTRQNIVELLYGFERENTREQLSRIEANVENLGYEHEKIMAGQEESFIEMRREFQKLQSRLARYVMAIMHAIAEESKHGPRLFTIEPADGKWELVSKAYRLHLWCEAEDCQHPVVVEEGKGIYEFKASRKWIKLVAPFANLIAGVLKTLLPVAAPAANLLFGEEVMNQLDIKNHLDLMKTTTGALLKGDFDSSFGMRESLLRESERSGILELHAFLHEKDPTHERLGLKRVPTYTGDYLWLCERHYQKIQAKFPEKIE